MPLRARKVTARCVSLLHRLACAPILRSTHCHCLPMLRLSAQLLRDTRSGVWFREQRQRGQRPARAGSGRMRWETVAVHTSPCIEAATRPQHGGVWVGVAETRRCG